MLASPAFHGANLLQHLGQCIQHAWHVVSIAYTCIREAAAVSSSAFTKFY